MEREENSENKWIEISTDVQNRTETIKAKIRDLAPDLFMKSVQTALLNYDYIGHRLQLYRQENCQRGKEAIRKSSYDCQVLAR